MPFPNIGAPELIVILIIALIVLGPGKLPDVAASLGKSLREFRKAASDVSEAGKLEASPTASTPTPSVPAAAPVAAATPPSSSVDADAARVPDGSAAPAGPARDPNLS
jgi:TatA/E family protein of Tat protein translocase